MVNLDISSAPVMVKLDHRIEEAAAPSILKIVIDKIPSVQSDGISPSGRGIGQTVLDGLNFIAKPIKKIIVFKQIGEMILIPYNIFSIVKSCLGFSKNSREKRIDAALSICDKVKQIGETSATFVVALEDIKAIPVSRVAWLTPFAAVMSVLSIASIVSNIRTCRKIKRVMKEFKFAEETGKVDGKATHASYRAMLDVIEQKQNEDSDFINDVFNIDKDKFADTFIDIELKVKDMLSSDAPEDVEKGQKILDKTIKTLKGRVKQNTVSSVLGLISSIVNVVGTTLLLALPVLPVGWMMIGVASIIDTGRWIRHKVVDYRFVKSVDVKRTTWEWITS